MIPTSVSLDSIQQMSKNSMVAFLGIEFTDIGKHHLSARMPVNEKTKQPFGLLHGGASVVLAETLGSVASMLVLPKGKVPVGLEINANHLKSVREGFVTGKATPIHIGKRTHVWSIEITNEEDQLICVSRMTIAVLEK